MSITSTGNSSIFSNPNASEPAAAQTAEADQSFGELIGMNDDPSDEAKKMLASITQDGAAGYWAWQIKQMREKAAAEVMGSMNLTAEKIAVMDAKERVAIEKKIEDLVEQMVKREIAEESKKKRQQALLGSASMQGIITHAQSIREQIEKKNVSAPSNPADPTDLLLFGS